MRDTYARYSEFFFLLFFSCPQLETNLVLCIAAPVRVLSNYNKLFLGSSDRIVSDAVWSGYGLRLCENSHSSSHSIVAVKCRCGFR